MTRKTTYNPFKYVYNKLAINDSFLSLGWTWYKYWWYLIGIIIIYFILGYRFSISFSGSDKNGIFFNIPQQIYSNVRISPQQNKIKRFIYCQTHHNCTHEYKFNTISRGQYVSFCIPLQKYADLAVTAGLPDDQLCQNGTTLLTKHIAGVPGDKVTIQESGVYINDHLLKNSKIAVKIGSEFKINQTLIIPDGYYYISGSSRGSFDSRYYGLVFIGNIKMRSYLLYEFNS